MLSGYRTTSDFPQKSGKEVHNRFVGISMTCFYYRRVRSNFSGCLISIFVVQNDTHRSQVHPSYRNIGHEHHKPNFGLCRYGLIDRQTQWDGKRLKQRGKYELMIINTNNKNCSKNNK